MRNLSIQSAFTLLSILLLGASPVAAYQTATANGFSQSDGTNAGYKVAGILSPYGAGGTCNTNIDKGFAYSSLVTVGNPSMGALEQGTPLYQEGPFNAGWQDKSACTVSAALPPYYVIYNNFANPLTTLGSCRGWICNYRQDIQIDYNNQSSFVATNFDYVVPDTNQGFIVVR